MVSVNLSVWRDLWAKKEAVKQDRYLKDLEGSPEITRGLKSPTILQYYSTTFTQSKTGKAPLRWDRNGVVREALPSDQYSVRVYGSRGNRKFLRAVVPAMEKKGSRFPHDQDTGMEREIDSAWGARGHRTQSADSNDGPGGGPTDGGAETRDAAPPDSQDDSYGAELIVDLGGIDFHGTRAHTGQGY